MSKTFLFRFDGKPENAGFSDKARENGHVVYQGQEMKIGRGWVPDCLEVVMEDDGACSFTLVELEANEVTALVSARKYLPESAGSILAAFREYLGRAIRRGRSSADSRVKDLEGLSAALGQAPPVRVWTAAALRQPAQIIEKLPLIDQAHDLKAAAHTHAEDDGEPLPLEGDVVLSPRDHKNVSRSVLLLDAVVRGWDKSEASLRAWRNLRSQPLRSTIRERRDDYPALVSLLLGQKFGVRLNINDCARELAAIWSPFRPERHSETSVLALIQRFMPVDLGLDPAGSVRIAFEKARRIVNEDAA